MAAVGDLKDWPGDAPAPESSNLPKDGSSWQTEPRGDNPFAQITDAVVRIVETPKPPRAWYIAFAISVTWLCCFLGSVAYLVWNGIGVWGNMNPVGWGWDIVAPTGRRILQAGCG